MRQTLKVPKKDEDSNCAKSCSEDLKACGVMIGKADNPVIVWAKEFCKVEEATGDA